MLTVYYFGAKHSSTGRANQIENLAGKSVGQAALTQRTTTRSAPP